MRWADHSVTHGMRQLLAAAVGDATANNQRFLFLSASAVPLHPPAVVHAQLMAETRSRVKACEVRVGVWGCGMAVGAFLMSASMVNWQCACTRGSSGPDARGMPHSKFDLGV